MRRFKLLAESLFIPMCLIIILQIPHETKSRSKIKDAWTIVKQADHDNYGFVSGYTGDILAGYDTKEEAVSAMKRVKADFKKPTTPKRPMWEPQNNYEKLPASVYLNINRVLPDDWDRRTRALGRNES